jgi:hypothetical protein
MMGDLDGTRLGLGAEVTGVGEACAVGGGRCDAPVDTVGASAWE